MTARSRPTSAQRYAWQVQDILVGCGLGHTGFSVVGGHTFHSPQVISVVGQPRRS
jgi:hypothetical protein